MRTGYRSIVVLSSAFLTGLVVMAFEMLLGHYLNPYFGSSIVTWGAIISTVLLSLTCGYFIGGSLADSHPHGKAIGILLLAAAAYFAVLPYVSDSLLMAIAMAFEDTRVGALTSASIFAAPLAILGMYCPFAVRLLMRDREHSGGVAGRIYGVSTIGSIVGTLGVAFYLVLHIGTRNITVLVAGITTLTALLNIFLIPVEKVTDNV